VLVIDAEIDVAYTDDVADVLRGAVIAFFQHGFVPSVASPGDACPARYYRKFRGKGAGVGWRARR